MVSLGKLGKLRVLYIVIPMINHRLTIVLKPLQHPEPSEPVGQQCLGVIANQRIPRTGAVQGCCAAEWKFCDSRVDAPRHTKWIQADYDDYGLHRALRKTQMAQFYQSLAHHFGWDATSRQLNRELASHSGPQEVSKKVQIRWLVVIGH